MHAAGPISTEGGPLELVANTELDEVQAAGAFSGIDMALRLIELPSSREVAETIQLEIGYDPKPPFYFGSPKTASP